MSFKIHISKDYLVFCAGHFITYEGGAEPLHGHNYRVAATLEGDLTAESYVVNFTTVKRLLRQICDSLDHRMLLARDNQLLAITEEGVNLRVNYLKKMYMFPSEDVIILPIPNTTAEKLAEWIGDQFLDSLSSQDKQNLTALEIEVEETVGQSAFCRKQLGLNMPQ